jgi:hypothetical protein
VLRPRSAPPPPRACLSTVVSKFTTQCSLSRRDAWSPVTSPPCFPARQVCVWVCVARGGGARGRCLCIPVAESVLRHRPLLNGRFQLLNLLGKGGFSEVWRALDLERGGEVAVKVHRLAGSWNDAKKQNYIKHATREHAIHKVRGRCLG